MNCRINGGRWFNMRHCFGDNQQSIYKLNVYSVYIYFIIFLYHIYNLNFYIVFYIVGVIFYSETNC